MSWIKNLFGQKEYVLNIFRASPRVSSKSQRGSLTIEAAVILPLFFMGMVALICVMDLQRIKTEVNISLNESVKELGMYAFALGEGESPIGAVDDALCMAYAQGKLQGDGLVSLNTLKSSYNNHMVELWVTGSYKLPVAIIPMPRIFWQSRVRVHDWTGYSGDDGEETANEHDTLVYVTPHQSVYHTSAACTHLDLSITQVTTGQVGNLRNKNGGKYHECSHCIGENYSGIIYITRTGDRYHASLKCQGLKRGIELVPQNSVSGLQECLRCQGNGG